MHGVCETAVTNLTLAQNGYASQTNARDGKTLWLILKERLLALVRMQRQWGNIYDLYHATSESRYEEVTLPKWIRDPDSQFSMVWDVMQVSLLMSLLCSDVRNSF